ncbi:MAG: dethiobiotin synthase [Gammaproteobacteria bacterium]
MNGCFVTGTDTEIGKTVVAAGIVHAFVEHGLRTAVMKPVASGGHETEEGLRNEDAECLIATSNVVADYVEVNPYCFAPPIAPHIAAAETGIAMELETILRAAHSLAARADVLVVEGVGGWRVPLAPDFDVPALAAALGLPVVLVVGLRLGCLNHALLSAESIRAAGCTLAGWVANTIGPAMERREENLATLEVRIAAPCLGRIPHLDCPTATATAGYLQLAGVLDGF